MTLPLIICIIGALAYVLGSAEQPNVNRISELGKYAFFAGLLAYLIK